MANVLGFTEPEKSVGSIVHSWMQNPQLNEFFFDFNKPENVAKVFGKEFPRYYVLENGYYWDYENQEVVDELPFKHFLKYVRGPKPWINRSERRRINRAVQKAREDQRNREKEMWNRLCTNMSILTEYQRIQSEAAQSISADTDDSDHTVADTDESDHVVADMDDSDHGVGQYSQDEIKAIVEETRAILLNELGRNALLLYFVWAVRNISNEILETPELRKKYLEPHSFVAERKISLADVFLFLMCAGGGNLSDEIYDYYKDDSDSDHTPPSSSAFVQRRASVKVEGFQYLYKRITRICFIISRHVLSGSPIMKEKFREFAAIFCTDGSGINIYLDPDDKDTFVPGGKNKGWNQYHLNGLADAVTGIFANIFIQPSAQTHETRAVAEMLKEMTFDSLTLLMGDRGYGSLNLVETIRRKENLECVIRVKEKWIKEFEAFPLEEFDQQMKIHIVTTQTKEDLERRKRGEVKILSGKSKFGKYKTSTVWDFESEVDVEFRVVRFQLSSGNWETLVTTLSKDKYSIEDLKELYHLRWNGIEGAFRNLKYDTHLAQMHSKKREFEKQEIYARVTMHNIVSCILNVVAMIDECSDSYEKHIAEMEEHAVEEQDGQQSNEHKSKKYEYILCRKFATHVIRDFFMHPDSINVDLIAEIRRHRSPVRLGRSYKRDMKAQGFRSFLYR